MAAERDLDTNKVEYVTKESSDKKKKSKDGKKSKDKKGLSPF